MFKHALPRRVPAPRLYLQRRWSSQSSTAQEPFPPNINEWSHPPSNATISDEEISRLAAKPRQPLTLADLVKYVLSIYHTSPLFSPPRLVLSLVRSLV